MTLDTASHPTDDTLLRMACNDLDAAERKAVLSHLDACEDCRAIWSAVEHVQAEAVRFDPGAIRPPERRFASYRHGLVAAAAVVVATVGLWIWSSSPESSEPPPVRSTAQRPAPAGLDPAEGARVQAPDFSWSAVDGAVGYTVEWLDADGRLLWTSDVLRTTRTAWPDAIERRPGEFYWRVSAVFDDGGAPTASPLVRFEVVTGPDSTDRPASHRSSRHHKPNDSGHVAC